jgi:circadian clock protein KaiB
VASVDPCGTSTAFEAQVRAKPPDVYDLRLYVAGASQRSLAAIAGTRAICEQHLAGRYILKVIDLYQQPGLAAQNGIIATPTLVKETPIPLRRLVGDMSNSDRVLRALDLPVGAVAGA